MKEQTEINIDYNTKIAETIINGGFNKRLLKSRCTICSFCVIIEKVLLKNKKLINWK